jgi:hypothetical protein
MSKACEDVGHNYTQVEAKEIRPKFVFCTLCGQLLKFDLDQATLLNPGTGLQPVAKVE